MKANLFLQTRLAMLPLACLLIAAVLSCSAPLSLAADNSIKIAKSSISDVTADTRSGILYFQSDGKRYRYQVVQEAPSTTLADFVELLGDAQYILTTKAYVQRNTDYYDGRVAIELDRILIGFGKADRLRE